MKIVNTKSITGKSFFILMNLSFVLAMSQLHEIKMVQILEIVLEILGIGMLFLHYMGTVKIKLSTLAAMISIVFVGILAYFISGGATLLKLVLFILAIQNVNEKEIFKYNNISLLIAFLIVIVSSVFGITEIMYVNRFKTAYRLGFTNPNTVPVVVFAIVTGYNIQNEEKLSIKALLLEGVVAFSLYYFCKSRTGAIVLGVYLLLIIFTKWLGKKKFFKYALYPFQYLFLAGIAGTYYLTVGFNASSEGWSKVNTLLSGRLYAWQRYLENYGIHVLGSKIEITYGALDNAYLQLLIKYGYLTVIVYAVAFIYISRYAYKNKRWIFFMTIIAYNIYFMCEFGPMLINFCSVLLVFGSTVMNERREKRKLG